MNRVGRMEKFLRYQHDLEGSKNYFDLFYHYLKFVGLNYKLRNSTIYIYGEDGSHLLPFLFYPETETNSAKERFIELTDKGVVSQVVKSGQSFYGKRETIIPIFGNGSLFGFVVIHGTPLDNIGLDMAIKMFGSILYNHLLSSELIKLKDESLQLKDSCAIFQPDFNYNLEEYLATSYGFSFAEGSIWFGVRGDEFLFSKWDKGSRITICKGTISVDEPKRDLLFQRVKLLLLEKYHFLNKNFSTNIYVIIKEIVEYLNGDQHIFLEVDFLDKTTRRLSRVSFGTMPIYRLRGKEILTISEGNPPLNPYSTLDFEVNEYDLRKSDYFIMFSDQLFLTRDRKEKSIGVDGYYEHILKNRKLFDPEEFSKSIPPYFSKKQDISGFIYNVKVL